MELIVGVAQLINDTTIVAIHESADSVCILLPAWVAG